MSLFRPDLLQGVRVALDARAGSGLASTLRALGASIEPSGKVIGGGERTAPHALVVDRGGELTSAGGEGLRSLLDELWVPIEGVVVATMIPAGEPGKVVLMAPSPSAGSHARAAAAAIVNLARTLSVEWARHRITVTALTPADHISASDLADLVAYLLSPGGDYFSGCRFELGAIRADPALPGPALARGAGRQFDDGSSGMRASRA